MEAVLSLLKDGTHGTHQDAEEGPYLLSAKNIKNGQIIIDDSSDRKISEDEFNQIHTKFTLENGDILLTIVGSIGESAILESAGKFTFQRSVAFLRPSEEMTSRFLKTEIESVQFQKELNDRKSQSAQPGVYLGDLSKIPIYITSKEEQKKIGKYFSHLDNLITLHQRKCDDTKELKKYMLQKMFPKNGEKFPEIRFKGFTEAWEQRKVKDISDFIDGNYGEKYPRDDEFVDSGIPFFTSAVTGSEGIFNEKNVKFISTEKNRELTKAQSQGGDLILTNRGASMGVIAEIPEKYGLVNIGPQLTRIRGKEKEANNKYLLCLFQTSTNNKKLTSMNAGSAMPFIGLKGLGNIDLLIPQYDEQLKIGEYFSCLDHFITLHRRAL